MYWLSAEKRFKGKNNRLLLKRVQFIGYDGIASENTRESFVDLETLWQQTHEPYINITQGLFCI